MNIIVGNSKSVIGSGTIVSIDEEPIRFVIRDGFIVNVRFVDDPVDKSARVDFNVDHEHNELNAVFTNFNAQLGLGNREAISLGTIGNRSILLNYSLYYIGTVEHHTRILHYTFMESAASEGSRS